MNGRLLLLRMHVPAVVRRSILRELVAAMARGFGHDGPSTSGLSAAELTEIAVDLSSTWADDAIEAQEDLTALRRRLFAEAEVLGRRARERLRVRSDTDGLEAVRLIYRAIGIDLRPRAWGDVVVARCAFATRYRPATCRLMSSMDSGLIAGLTGADGLRFTARLTEGAPACRARILHARGAA